MSWFDKLFGEDNDSNDDLLRKIKRRQGTQSQQNNQDSLLPQNNDIYNRPRGKFRFPMHVSEEASYNDLDNDKNMKLLNTMLIMVQEHMTHKMMTLRNLVDNSGKDIAVDVHLKCVSMIILINIQIVMKIKCIIASQVVLKEVLITVNLMIIVHIIISQILA